MTLKEMIHIVQTQLAIDLNCTVDDLNWVGYDPAFVTDWRNDFKELETGADR